MAGILSLLMGRELCGRYRVDSVIGTGGMGAVCRGYDVKLERRVAVKVMTAVVKDDDEQERLRGRFYREARAAARLRHPHVVTVHDFGTDEALGIDFLVMELLEGRDLSARLRQAGGPLPLAEAMEILRESCMGLAAGHRAGLVHRDVKPGNVYLVEERGGWEVKLLDFGIALMNDFEGDTLTRFTVAGAPHTPRYASPEQLAGGAALTPASDVYSLALTGLEMLGGEYPQGLNADADSRAAARAVKRLVDRRPEVPLRLAAVLRRALRIDPASRFADANELLEALLEADAIAATSAGRPAFTFEREAAPTPPPATAAASAATPPADRSEGTRFAPPPKAAPDPLAALRPPLHGAPPAATGTAAPPAEAGTDAQEAPPPRRRRVPTLWAAAGGAALLGAVVGLLVNAAEPGRGEADPRPPVVDEVGAGQSPGGVGLAREEAERVTTRHGAEAGDRLFVVVLASFGAPELGEAREFRDRLRERGYDVGLANSLVYPELRDGFVAVVAGPYARGQAEEELERLRGEIASDAFLKSVTLRVP